jgi:hypothetical protein
VRVVRPAVDGVDHHRDVQPRRRGGPESRGALPAKRALDGDFRAIDELIGFCEECRWAYEATRR